MKKTSMRKRNYMIWFMMLGLYFSCAGPGQSPQRSETFYSEDLSVLRRNQDYKTAEPEAASPRPAPERTQYPASGAVTANQDVTNQLENLLTASAERNKEIKTLPGFTVQVYLGTSREAAERAKRQVYSAVPEARPEVKFVQPNYRVIVGRFVERMEAQTTYASLKKEFPNALVIPDRIQINE
ncbi:sporulation domain-containing protein [Flammeovirgaceae bacterium 311]|nr:sporulation domain-containing protein [Flammeovirgaceae bacterium 311]